jgi:hypothetical protein
MKTDLKVELFSIHQTYFPDNHGNRAIPQVIELKLHAVLHE